MPKLPLEGVRIVAIPVVFAGPFATMLLADLGAEVILVESIQRFPTITRGYMPRPPQELVPTTGATFGGTGGIQTYVDHWAGDRPWDRFVMFHALGRNKLSCCIDLDRPDRLGPVDHQQAVVRPGQCSQPGDGQSQSGRVGDVADADHARLRAK